MRRSVLTEWMCARTSEVQVDVLEHILHRGRTGGAPFHLALAALVDALALEGCLPYELREDIYTCARATGKDDLSHLFLSAITPPVAERAHHPVDRTGRPLTLGERKSLARVGRRELLDRLLRDPDAPVIRALLTNPKLTERDVIVVSAKRPQDPDVLREVSQSRWIRRYRVKRAIALNPYTPSDLAIRLLSFLSDADLKLVADGGFAAEVVRQAAARLPRSREP
jgi:hypothetical protein